MATRRSRKQRLPRDVVDSGPSPLDQLILIEEASRQQQPPIDIDTFLREVITYEKHRNRLKSWLIQGGTCPEIARDENVSHQAVVGSVSKGLSVLEKWGVDKKLIAEIRINALEERTDMGRAKLLAATRGLGLSMEERQKIVVGILERRKRE